MYFYLNEKFIRARFSKKPGQAFDVQITVKMLKLKLVEWLNFPFDVK